MPEQRVRLPAGFALVEDGSGGFEVIRQQEHLVRTLAWRVNEENYARIAALAATFPGRTTAEAMRWLLGHPQVQEIMAEKIRSRS